MPERIDEQQGTVAVLVTRPWERMSAILARFPARAEQP
jgi:hypothetical protein